MGKLKDKVVGKTKQAVAEVLGDGNLNEEGKEQARTIEPTKSEPPRKQLGNLDKLTRPTLAAQFALKTRRTDKGEEIVQSGIEAEHGQPPNRGRRH